MGPRAQFAWRPITTEQVRQWAALLAAIETVDRQDVHLSEQDLLEDFGDPDRDFPRGSVAVYDGSAMIGYGLLRLRAAADRVHEMRQQGSVHPGYRGRGLGGRLLDWAEQAAIPLHRERFPGRPLSLSGQCLSRNSEAVALYATHGYRESRRFYLMARDLSVPISGALSGAADPAGVDIVGFTARRAQDALLVRNEAFREHWGSTQVSSESWARFTRSRAFRPPSASWPTTGRARLASCSAGSTTRAPRPPATMTSTSGWPARASPRAGGASPRLCWPGPSRRPRQPGSPQPR